MEGPDLGPLQNIHDLRQPQSEILNTILQQSRMLQKYKDKFGELEPEE